jgi:hypothetical protein
MGNSVSLSSRKVFEKELDTLNTIVSSIIDDKNVFRNADYNFLSQDVCERHTVVLEEELHKHLKVSLHELGTSLYLIPNNDSNNKTTIKGSQTTKRDICAKISSHYMKILYILTLIKYVYDLENQGDYSIAGIIFRNVKIVDDIMSIDFCSMNQKDYSQKTQDHKIDFGQLEGMSFFVDYVLDERESKVFVDVLRSLLSRSNKGNTRQQLCQLVKSKRISRDGISKIEKLYQQKYGVVMQCSDESRRKTTVTPGKSTNPRRPNLFMRIEKDNPVFLKDYCYNVNQVVFKMDSSKSKVVTDAFRTMQANYKNNVKEIESFMNRLVTKNGGKYILRDITKQDLDLLIDDVKSTVKLLYIQSIVDYQHLLDIAKNNQNIQINKDR